MANQCLQNEVTSHTQDVLCHLASDHLQCEFPLLPLSVPYFSRESFRLSSLHMPCAVTLLYLLPCLSWPCLSSPTCANLPSDWPKRCLALPLLPQLTGFLSVTQLLSFCLFLPVSVSLTH